MTEVKFDDRAMGLVLLFALGVFIAVAWWSLALPGLLGLAVLGCAPPAAAAAIGLGAKSLEWSTNARLLWKMARNRRRR